MNKAAQAMGRIKTAKKAAASRENGKLGGRPRNHGNKSRNMPKHPLPAWLAGHKIERTQGMGSGSAGSHTKSVRKKRTAGKR